MNNLFYVCGLDMGIVLGLYNLGSIDSEDVRRKFVSQRETKDRLTTLKTTTENQKKDFQLKCQQLNEEFEQCRFSDAQDKEQYVEFVVHNIILYNKHVL